MGCVWIKLDTVRIVETAYMSCEFNDGNLHTKAQTKVWNLVFSCVAGGKDLALYTTDAESARNKDSVYISEDTVNIVCGKFFGIDPFDVDCCVEWNSTML